MKSVWVLNKNGETKVFDSKKKIMRYMAGFKIYYIHTDRRDWVRWAYKTATGELNIVYGNRHKIL